MKKILRDLLRMGLVIAGLIVFISLTACSSGGNSTISSTTTEKATSSASANAVAIANFAFSPTTLTVKAGTTVTWTNSDSATHTVTSDNGVFDSGSMANGKTYSFTFNQTGTFPYHCTFHPSMKATVIVQ
jgi:plastocyanin